MQTTTTEDIEYVNSVLTPQITEIGVNNAAHIEQVTLGTGQRKRRPSESPHIDTDSNVKNSEKKQRNHSGIAEDYPTRMNCVFCQIVIFPP